jgi:twitching motility two-component system response regulator PilH
MLPNETRYWRNDVRIGVKALPIRPFGSSSRARRHIRIVFGYFLIGSVFSLWWRRIFRMENCNARRRIKMASSKILVVEDSPTYLRKIAGFLQGLGYEVSTAIDGEEALEKAMQENPSLIVLDVILPKKNGFQVCRQLKTTPATQGIKILMMTSKSQDSDRFWGLKQGADEYMTKPFDDNELVTSVAKLLSQDHQASRIAEG